MTRIYFIRHAEPDFNVHDDFSRPLTAKGESDRTLVEEFLADKNIDVVLSSPFKRAFDTVETFARKANLTIRTIDDFRERKVDDTWIHPFDEFTGKQWADFSYKLPAGESLSEVQKRNIATLERVLEEYQGKNIVIGTHGTALSTIIHYYDNTYGYEGFTAMKLLFPWVAQLDFKGNECTNIKKINLFNQKA